MPELVHPQPSLRDAVLALLTRPVDQTGLPKETGLPNEIVDMILVFLPRASLKQARLVCRQWAICVEAFLVSTVYLSPREKDMEVFDNITSHPSMSKSVKHLFYDTALFRDYSLYDYFVRLCAQLNCTGYKRMRMEDPYVQELIATINGRPVRPGQRAVARPFPSQGAFRRFQEHTAFHEGYSQYQRMVQQQNNIIHNIWLLRAWQGLQRLGDIHTVTLSTRWRTSLFRFPTDESEWEREQWDDNEVDGPFLPEEADKPGVGSPVARAWPATYLLPTVTTFRLSSTNGYSPSSESVADGSLAINLVLRLLQFAKKKPQQLLMQGGSDEPAAGVPAWMFEPFWLHPNHFSSASDLLYFQPFLKVLCLDMGCFDTCKGRTKELCPKLDLLKSFLKNASELEMLILNLPNDLEWDNFDYGSLLYTLDQAFPLTPGWYLSKIRQLCLGFVSGSFMQFAQLLFLSLPELEMLIMHTVQLEDECWEEIVEGLANLGTVRRCTLFGLLYPSATSAAANGLQANGLQRSSTIGPDVALAMSQYVVDPQRRSFLPENVLAGTSSKDRALRRLGPTMEQRQELLSQLATLKKNKKEASSSAS
ncbi:MAG: hypothetical protein L6R37_006847 [Teloschistes peruensis]|nr:MAG: hypothetical protein L6R37_006847 [Teloschistes peruensis]